MTNHSPLLAAEVVGLITLVFAVGAAAPAMAASEAECSALFRRPDVYASGRLSAAYSKALMESGRWVAADGTVDRTTITNGCIAGAFDLLIAALEGGAPFVGDSTYSESQARGVIERGGFTSVSNLRKDDQGIWRAAASRAGTPVTIALDYRGNLVAK